MHKMELLFVFMHCMHGQTPNVHTSSCMNALFTCAHGSVNLLYSVHWNGDVACASFNRNEMIAH